MGWVLKLYLVIKMEFSKLSKDSKAFIVKFGSGYLNRYPKFEQYSKNKKINFDKWNGEDIIKFRKELEKKLSEERSIRKWERLKIRDDTPTDHSATMILPKEKEVYSYFYDPYFLEVYIPLKNQKGTDFDALFFGNKNVDKKEDFKLIYDGMHWIYFRQVDLSKTIYSGVYDVRELFIGILKKIGTFVNKAPNPLRFNFLYIFTDDKLPDGINFGVPANINSYEVVFYPLKILNKEKLFFYSQLFAITNNLREYYSLSGKNFLLEQEAYKSNEVYSNILTTLNKIYELKNYNILLKLRRFKTLEKEYSTLYFHLGKYMTNKAEYDRDMLQFKRNITNNKFFKNLKEDIINEFDEPAINCNEIMKSIESVNFFIDRFSSNKYLIITSIVSVISVIIGGLITYIFTRI